jgi:DNA modification methylase
VKQKYFDFYDSESIEHSINNDKIELFSEFGESLGYYSKKNKLNNLTGKEWVYWTKSVINKQYPPNLQHKLRSQHGGQKPPELCQDLIKIFTKKGQSVLDPFAGVGGTLIGASLCNRIALGIEIEPKYVDIYKEVCHREGLDEQAIICGDSRVELDNLSNQGRYFDFVLTDVPYWNMDSVPRSKGKYKRVGQKAKDNRKTKLKPFSESLYQSKDIWLEQLYLIFEKTIKLLKKNHYLAVFIGDMYNNGEYHFLSAELAVILKSLSLKMKANIIWYDVSKSLHVYGYLYEYIPSMIHQNILIFRKEHN